ncbi:acetyl-CoA acetyltransferase [Rhodococcus koreensis]
MAQRDVFVLGGSQTDFSRVWTREALDLADLMREVVQDALESASTPARDVEVAHVGNFAGELYVGQGHLGGLLVEADPAFAGLPTSRHEAACASGSMAVLAAMADIESGRYDVALVVGAEIMRTTSGFESQKNLAAGAWVPRETDGVDYLWPETFNAVAEEYDRRYGLDHAHLAAIAANNLENAKHNPLSQTRGWKFTAESFSDNDDANPTIAGMLRRQDCSPVTDGGAAIVLASADAAQQWSARTGRTMESIPRISGWGHATARMALADKLADSRDSRYVAPHLRKTIVDSFRRARIADATALDTIECHDCFTISEYVMIDHLGLTEPGASWQVIEDGAFALDGKMPINPSGGLIGVGHPVGASGVRMLLDAARQVEGTAGPYQIPGARRAAALNVGGSLTTTACFVVEAAQPAV